MSSPPERRRPSDRRHQPRPASPGRRASDRARIALVVALCAASSAAAAGAEPEAAVAASTRGTAGARAKAADGTIGFGLDVNSARRAQSLGLPVKYGSIWTAAWSRPEKYGLGGIKTQLQAAKAAGVTPVVQWWYWGDDITPSCVENGCIGKYDGVRKDKDEWYRMSRNLANLIAEVMGESETLLVLETEFNKGGIGRYEPFDGYLVDHIRIFHDKGIKVALGFGNWDRHLWKNFDRAVAESDVISIMILHSSVREGGSEYLDGPATLLSATKFIKATFNKPSFITDFGFSSYPEPSYELYQDTVIRAIFAHIEDFREAGVQGMVWRMLADDPKFNTANYHKVAERHWGLVRADGTPKLAFTAFRNGMLSEMDRAAAMQGNARRTEPGTEVGAAGRRATPRAQAARRIANR